MPTRPSKLPRDFNQRVKMIVDTSTGNAPAEEPKPEKNPHAVALAALGASKGGKARAAKLLAKRRQQIAKKAIKTRWAKHKAKD